MSSANEVTLKSDADMAGVLRAVLDAWDGETARVLIGDFRLVIVRAEDDCETSINDFDCYGKVQCFGSQWSASRQRPPGFDGSARKWCIGGDVWWWQPYREGAHVYDSAEEQRRVELLLEYGFAVVVAEVYSKCHCCDQWTQMAYESLGGVDEVDDLVLSAVVASALCSAGIFGTVTPT